MNDNIYLLTLATIIFIFSVVFMVVSEHGYIKGFRDSHRSLAKRYERRTAEEIKCVLNLIDAEISKYEADIALTHDNDFDNHCDLCNETLFKSIHNIINKYRRSDNE